MLDRTRGGSVPPKWRSSLAVYAYPVPLEQTADDYPNSRIVYLKVSASITGWAESETLAYDEVVLTPDAWVHDAWDTINTDWQVSQYWACLCAFVQLSIHPRQAAGVADDDYPYVMDFEPKKRELYEAATDTKEMLSASSRRAGTQKGTTTTNGTESDLGMSLGFSYGGFSLGGTASEKSYSSAQRVDMTTSDASTERRETQGYSTQLSQMYQLFNGYHLGTNRALFAIFARPHTRTDSEQLANNLVNGERRLEGIQDMFVVVHLPKSMSGICLDAWIDTGHKVNYHSSPTSDLATPLVLTRRLVTGCGDFAGDRLQVAPTPAPPGPRVTVIGEAFIDAGDRFQRMRPGEFARLAKGNHVVAADHLNLLQAEVQQQALAAQLATNYAPRRYSQTAAFRQRATVALRGATTSLATLVTLKYLDGKEQSDLIAAGVKTAGDVFSEKSTGTWPAVVLEVRARLLDGLLAALKPKV